jgi:phosphoglycerate dehydrogenase-like enzyme
MDMAEVTVPVKRVAVLDDYQDVARLYADWSVLDGRVGIQVFTTHIPEEDELVDALKDFEIIVAMRERTPFRRGLLERLPRLELLVTTGPINAAIDLAAATDKRIPVWGTRGFLPPAMELTWALILACAKNVCRLNQDVKAGAWQTRIGRDLHGARLGVVGLGYYGLEVARIGLAFGMDVVAWSQNLTAERCVEAGVTHVTKQELLETSDFVTIHLVLSDRTRGLIGASDLQRMKPTAYLVNTSRGPIVHEPALVRSLEEGWIAGAGLDVFDREPLPPHHPFRPLGNVITTPHVGYVTDRSYEVFFEDVVDNIVCFLDGRVGRALDGTFIHGVSPSPSALFRTPG